MAHGLRGFRQWLAELQAKTTCWKGMTEKSCSVHGRQEAKKRKKPVKGMHPHTP